MHTIRLAQEPAPTDGMVWLRLATDPTGFSTQFDEAKRNHVPTAIVQPAGPNLGVTGQPALAWITLLEVRQAHDGRGLELWGLTRWLPAAEAHLARGEHLWARVTLGDHVDARTGRKVGARLQAVELTDSPLLMSRSPIANDQPTKEGTTMKPSDTTTALLAALPSYSKGSPNHAIALERAALGTIPEAAQLSRAQLYEQIIHPALAELGRQRIAAASRAGTLRQSLPTLASARRPAPQAAPAADLPVLDVRDQSAGRNATEKLVLHVKAKNPRLSHDAAFLLAMQLKQTHRIVA